MFNNMKIEINEQQPLDEVVKELERLGYENQTTSHFDMSWICAGYNKVDNYYSFSNRNHMPTLWGDLTTLAELKDMPLNDFGFDFKQQPSNTVELGMQMLEEGVK